MIEQLDQVQTTGIIVKFANFTAKKLLQLKLKLKMGLNEEIYNKVNELHHRYKDEEKRMVIIPLLIIHILVIYLNMIQLKYLHILIVFKISICNNCKSKECK